jgi:hypothetical protein
LTNIGADSGFFVGNAELKVKFSALLGEALAAIRTPEEFAALLKVIGFSAGASIAIGDDREEDEDFSA